MTKLTRKKNSTANSSSNAGARLYIGGTFDLFHSGHIKLLKKARQLGTVIVSVNTDEFASQYKRKPVLPLKERIAVLKACKYVDEVVVNTGGTDSRPAILKTQPTHIVHGDDWTGKAYLKQLGIDRQFLKDNKIKLLYFPYTKSVSTTKLCQRFQ